MRLASYTVALRRCTSTLDGAVPTRIDAHVHIPTGHARQHAHLAHCGARLAHHDAGGRTREQIVGGQGTREHQPVVPRLDVPTATFDAVARSHARAHRVAVETRIQTRLQRIGRARMRRSRWGPEAVGVGRIRLRGVRARAVRWAVRFYASAHSGPRPSSSSAQRVSTISP